MNEFDNINNTEQNNATNNCEDNTKSELPRNTHGVYYTPDDTNRSYTSRQYTVNDDQPIIRKVSDSDASQRIKRNTGNSDRSTVTKAILIGAVVLCILLSAFAGFGSAYIGNLYFASQSETPDSKTKSPIESTSGSNTSYVDFSDNSHTVETVEPGTLMSMEEAIQAVKDSVVEITTETVKSGFGGYSQYVVSGAGSGVIISTAGYIITNNHVIDGATNIIVRLTDGTEYEAVLVGTDVKTDVAVIAIKPSDEGQLISATVGTSSTLCLGQTVIAIGNPLGKLGGTVTDGIISSLARQIAVDGGGYMTLLQTNAAVNPGNSGGGLFDLYGRLVGVVNAKSSGQGIEGISFAIPIDTAWDVATQLIDKGYVSGRPSLGVSLKQVQYGASFFGDIYTQVVVAKDHDVYGLKENDIIISVNGFEIIDLNDVSESISANKVGDSVVVRIKRDRKYYELNITLVENVPSDNRPSI